MVRSLLWYRAALPLMLFFLLLTVLAAPGRAKTEEVDCSICHGDLADKKVVHAAVQMGCPSCHSGIAGIPDIPHRNTTSLPRGLSTDQPELCFGCHDRGKFTGKKVHAALSMGCTGCHDPHSSPNEKLLKTAGAELCHSCHDKAAFEKKFVHAAVGMGCTSCHAPHASKNERLLLAAVPDLCMNCHDSAMFSKANAHAPVAGGLCLSCHTPHAADQAALLRKAASLVCLDCHDGVQQRPHAVAGISRRGHPLGIPRTDKDGEPRKRQRKIEDPAREDKPFSCASCHDPHGSDHMSLFRYEAKSAMQLCKHCHKR